MNGFRHSLSYGFLDQVVARLFDFATLWVVLRTLPDADLATYGVATAMLFVFNLILLTPEAALIRDKKVWAEESALQGYLKGFLLFAELRILALTVVTGLVSWLVGTHSAYFFACLLALINQFIMLAEIARVDYRIDLQQREVFGSELVLKAGLLALVTVLFVHPGLRVYLGLFMAWALLSALFWLVRLRRKHGVGLNLDWPRMNNVFRALADFSLWQHLSGVVTYIIYNIDPWVLTWFSARTATVSTYTLALKVSALFFMVPMFLQSMITIFLVNCATEHDRRRTFRKMFLLNAVVAAGQLLLFLLLGEWIGRLFRGASLDASSFYQLGLVLSLGVFVLNLARPLIAVLILHVPMQRLLVAVYLPVLVFALLAYVGLTAQMGALGCALASALSYGIFALLLSFQSVRSGVARAALSVVSLQRA